MKPIQLCGHSRPITQVMFNSTGDLLFTSGKEGALCVWDVESGSCLGKYKITVDGKVIQKVICGFDVTLDSTRLLVASAEGIFIFDVETKEQLEHIQLNSVCRAVRWNTKPGHQNHFVAIRDGFKNSVTAALVVFYLDPSTGMFKAGLEITTFTSKCVGVAWGPFDETIISYHEDGVINVWNSTTGEKNFTKQAHSKQITCMDFSPDRSLCLTSCADGTAKLWTVHDWEEVQTYTTDRPLNSCSLSPLYSRNDSTRRLHIIVAGGQSASEVTTTKTQEGKQEVVLLHMVTAEILGLIAGHFSPVNSIAFMPNGKGFATGAEEGYVRLYKFDPSYFDPAKFA